MSKLATRLKRLLPSSLQAAVKVPLPEGWQHPERLLGTAHPLQLLHQGAAKVCANTNGPLGSCQIGKGATPSLQDEGNQRNMCPGYRIMEQRGHPKSSGQAAGSPGPPDGVWLARRSTQVPVRLLQPRGIGTNEAALIPFLFSQVGAPHPTRMHLKEQDTSFVPGNK